MTQRDEREKLREALKLILVDMIQRNSNRLIIVDYETTIDYILAALSPAPADGEAHAEIQRLQDAKRRALTIADERAKENVALREALKTALRQWKMYADMYARPEEGSFNIADERTAEGDLFRHCKAALTHALAAAENDPSRTTPMAIPTAPSEPIQCATREAMVSVTASLAAAISLLERTPKAKKAAPSDMMFAQMLADYRRSLEIGRAALPSTDRLPPSETDGLLSGDYPLPIEHYERVARNLAAVWSNGNDGARTCILAALLKAAAPVETSRLELLLREYARDLRRNSGGGDDYPWEWAKATADYLETLIDRASALTPADGGGK